MERVAEYYFRMARENDPESAMAHTLEMFEGLTEAQIDFAIREYGKAKQ